MKSSSIVQTLILDQMKRQLPDGHGPLSIPQLSREVGICERYGRLAVRDLRSAGLIEVSRCDGSASIYRIQGQP